MTNKKPEPTPQEKRAKLFDRVSKGGLGCLLALFTWIIDGKTDALDRKIDTTKETILALSASKDQLLIQKLASLQVITEKMSKTLDKIESRVYDNHNQTRRNDGH